jgi:hypothetical protein
MTKTEERLRDALHASASRAHDDRLRPLRAPQPGSGEEPSRTMWRSWLAPVAAAVSVALVVGLALALTGGPVHPAGSAGQASPTSGRATVSLPRYYVEFIPSSQNSPVVVRSTATGAVVASVPAPKLPGKGWLRSTDAVAAAPSDRTFYVEYDLDHVVRSGFVAQIWIYRFTVSGDGSLTPLTRIKGGVLSGSAELGNAASLAVSPDGTQLALTTDSTNDLEVNSPGYADQITVIELATGRASEWRGGMYRAQQAFTIPDLSWAADGRSLIYLALWCDGPEAVLGVGNRCSGADVTAGYRDTQVRSLSTATGGGALDDSRLLLTQSARFPAIAQAVAGPAGDDITALVLSGRVYSSGAWQNLAVDRISAPGGSVLGADYARSDVPVAEGVAEEISLFSDPGGHYVLFAYPGPIPGGSRIGWVSDGIFHRLPLPDYEGQSVAW